MAGGSKMPRWMRLAALAGMCAALACAVLVCDRAAAQAQTPSAPGRGPAYRLIELPSGRVLAEARPDVLASQLGPGSVIKAATLVAAVEAGIVDERTRIACRRTMMVDGKRLTCVHPDLHRPLTAAEALGHSCNVFFATVAQRLPRQALDGVLVRAGLPPVSPGAPLASAALGLSGIRATPPQLLDAFLRLVGPSPRELAMPEAARRMLRAGTELAARTGTAAALEASGFSGLAKTGTAPMPGGGVAGVVVAVISTERPTHAIVVVAPGAAGSDAAAEAATILTRHGAPRRHLTEPAVRVGIAMRDGTGYDAVPRPLEDYVSQVVAGEMGPSAPAAALEAIAIAARTFAVANAGRHAADGFDVCDLTHCQVLAKASPSTEAAARATAGLILADGGTPADVYYSAWCGGHTESPSRVWPGARARTYLPARPDTACAREAAWTSDLAEPQVRRALAAAGLKGDSVTNFAILSRHPSGRVNVLAVEGMTPDRISGEAFRASAGRALGWQYVKSTLFDLERTATGYRLTGRGMGHGVGLCIKGATARARAGATRDDILAAYFPGLSVTTLSALTTDADGAAARGTRISVVLPEADRGRTRQIQAVAERLLRQMATKLSVDPPAAVDLVFHATVEAYRRETGQPWWTAARTSGSRIDLLPPGVLDDRRILEPTLRHEFVHLLSEPLLPGRALWVREGLAVVMAGEWRDAAGDARGSATLGACPSDAELRSPRDGETWRRAYDAAGRCVAKALAGGRGWRDLR